MREQEQEESEMGAHVATDGAAPQAPAAAAPPAPRPPAPLSSAAVRPAAPAPPPPPSPARAPPGGRLIEQLLERPPAVQLAMLRAPSDASMSICSDAARHALRDTSELIRAACSLPPLRGHELRELVAPALQEGEEALLARLRFRFDRAGVKFRHTRVVYRGLSIERTAAAGAAEGVPTVGSVVRDAFRSVAGRTKRSSVRLLDGVDGVLRPRTMTLLLGPPGSGKTTLMRALTGRLKRDRHTRLQGDIEHNGHPISDFVVERSSSYVDQVDQLLPALTVRETLSFAEACLGPSATTAKLFQDLVEWEAANGVEKTPEDETADALLAHMSAGQHAVMTAYMLHVMGLEHAADTLVGDAMLRGISGGEKRRVTTSEMMVSQAQFMCLDSISTGLDSAATLEIVASLRRSARLLDCTMLVSLLQPEPEVVALFDDIICMAEGRVIWHGPAGKAPAHFASLGLAPPPGLDIADFLLLVASPQDHAALAPEPAGAGAANGAAAGQQRASSALSVGRRSSAGGGAAAGRVWTTEALSRAFWESEAGLELRAAVKADPSVPREQDHPLLFAAPYAAPWHALLAACLRRATTLEWRRNWGAAAVRWLVALVISLAAGSIFWQVPASFQGAVAGMGMLFWVLCFVLTITVPTVHLTYARRLVVLRQRADRFYAGWMDAVPQVLVNLPILLVDVVVMGIPVYWMVGFAPDAGRFFTFLLIMLALNVAMDNFYRLLGSFMPNLHVGVAVGVTILIAFELLAGFTISPGAIPQPWKTVYYLNPLAYAFRAAAVNELRSERWTSQPAPPGSLAGLGAGGDAHVPAPGASLSDSLLDFFQLESSGDWVWIGVGVLAGWAVAYVAGTMVAFSLFKEPAQKAAAAEEAEGALAAAATGELVLDAAALALVAEGEPPPPAEDAPGPAFEPVAVAFQGLCYFVPHPKERGKELELLKGVTGSFLPGRMTALMGSSGAGKTTLMDVVAGRKTVGRIEGGITTNGRPKDARAFARVMGYVEQTDVHAPLATVGEALRFAAALRLPAAAAPAEREALVRQVVGLVELGPLEGALVGVPGVSGLSTEQRKRLTIGVELVTNPSVIFMDEPSSGLDARAAAVVMGVVRAVASSGRTVVCTIHQPSAAIFSAFDDLLLLRRGGAVVYNGEAAGVVGYLSQFVGPSRTLEPGRNPASWMLEVVAALGAPGGGAGGGAAGGKGAGKEAAEDEEAAGVDLAAEYQKSDVCKAAERRAAEAAAGEFGGGGGNAAAAGGTPAAGAGAGGGGAPGAWAQFGALMRRNLLAYWRDPGHNVSRYVITVGMSILIGTVELGKGRLDHLTDARGVQNGMGAMYMLAISLAFEAAFEAQNSMTYERVVYAREHASRTYGPGPYLAAQALVEAPFLLPQALVYTVALYFLIGLRASAAGFFFALLVVLASCWAMVLLAQALVHVTPAPYLASLLLSVVGGSLFNVLCGFMAPLPTLPPWWRWFYYSNPLAHSLYAITADQLGDVDQLLPSPLDGGGMVSVSEYVAIIFGIQRGGPGVFPGQWGAVGMLGALAVFYFACSYLGLRFLQYQKR